MSVTKPTFCRICEPNCPMLADINDQGEVETLRPNPEHPYGGTACHKGLSFLDVHRDPDRLNYPLRRKNSRQEAEGDFERISWDRALSECSAKLKAILDEHGPNAIAVYMGNPIAFNSRLATYYSEFLHLTRSIMVFGATSQDVSNKSIGSIAIYGSFAMMVPDIENTEYLLCLGANPRVSKWTIASAPNDALKVLENINRRGGKVRFVNPRKIESSTPSTGETLLIKPDTDVYFLAAVLHELEKNGGFDQDTIARMGSNIEGLKAFIADYPADKVADVTGLQAEEIKAVAAEIAAAKSAAVYMSTGVNQGRQGLLAFWLGEMISFVTGNFGRAGGSYKPTSYTNKYRPVRLNGQSVETSVGPIFHPKPLTYGVAPGALMADLAKNGDIKALVTFNGNPLLTVGGEGRMREGFKNLELMVTLDIAPNATAEISDYVLPATDFLEREDTNHFTEGLQTGTPYVQYTDAMAQPKAERRDDWWIISKITEGMGLKPKSDGDGFEYVNKILAASEVSVDDLKAAPQHTVQLPEGERSDVFERCLKHDDGKVNCCPPEFAEAGLFDRCKNIFESLQSEPEGTLKLISLRTPYMHNSWMANIQRFRRGGQSVNPLNICAADALAKDLLDGDRVRVFNENGSIETRVLINDDLRPGAVAMSHGYGGGRRRLKIASEYPGANYNRLLPTGPGSYEPLSHMSWMNGVPVQVERIS